MPAPRSRTLKRTSSPATRALTSIAEPGGENLAALSSRLSRAWTSFGLSLVTISDAGMSVLTGRSMPSLVTLSCTSSPRSNWDGSTAIVRASISPSWRKLSMILLSRSASLTRRSAKRCLSLGDGSPRRLSAVSRSEVIGVFSSCTRLATNSWRTVARRRSSVTSVRNIKVSPARRLASSLTSTVRRWWTRYASDSLAELPRTSTRLASSVTATRLAGRRSCSASPAPVDVGSGSLTGAGATFPAPLYQKAFFDYSAKYPQVTVNYQSVGSGAGISQFQKGTVDFGASDVPMADADIAKVPGGATALVQVPTTLGVISIAYNLSGVNKLQLDGPTLANIFLGHITKWNDPAIL